MKLSIPVPDLCNYYSRQLNNFFPDEKTIHPEDMKRIADTALDRLHYCFKHVAFARYNKDGETLYNHLYADHNIVFNWILGNTAHQLSENDSLATKLYYLNKTLHSFDCMYDTKMPDIFLVFHGAGTMLGKASYSDFFVALHGCTVGSNKGIYPTFGKGVALAAHSSVIGNCTIGSRVSFSAYANIIEESVDSDKVVFRNNHTGAIEIKNGNTCYAQQFFNVDLKNY
ncbi:hypothetical protein ACTHGU_18710 [Chitinophagaceae bacterium MMS25-I14]